MKLFLILIILNLNYCLITFSGELKDSEKVIAIPRKENVKISFHYIEKEVLLEVQEDSGFLSRPFTRDLSSSLFINSMQEITEQNNFIYLEMDDLNFSEKDFYASIYLTNRYKVKIYSIILSAVTLTLYPIVYENQLSYRMILLRQKKVSCEESKVTNFDSYRSILGLALWPFKSQYSVEKKFLNSSFVNSLNNCFKDKNNF
jgi:hypothetical protein